ncbi:hypothetical protein EW145_g3007, partial [Phellinidium pouzarii]
EPEVVLDVRWQQEKTEERAEHHTLRACERMPGRRHRKNKSEGRGGGECAAALSFKCKLGGRARVSPNGTCRPRGGDATWVPMAGLERLTAIIYHERQQPGSMLCAQHALNSLLQGNYFTAPDLAAIANSFDALEQDALGNEEHQAASTNMDDSGFFSVQVMDKALDVWGLNLLRWRSEQMRPFQDTPQTQLAFVLNLHQHWFTLRRFGPAHTEPGNDPGEGHWFNLNSQYLGPKWVSRTYLGMFLQQSEEEGYSVFAVVQADPSKPLALPRTEADNIAASLDAPDSSLCQSSTSMSSSFPGLLIPEDTDYDVENEDLELQAALAASLGNGDYELIHDSHIPRAPVPAPELRQAPLPPAMHFNNDDEDNDMALDADFRPAGTGQPPPTSDPVAASLARSRALLDQMQRAQEAALRETYVDEADDSARSARARAEQEEETEAVRRAIAASMAEGNAEGRMDGDDEDEEDGEWLPEAEDKENVSASMPTRRRENELGAGSASSVMRSLLERAQTSTRAALRVYDDEDSELQAALRASLDTMPEGFVHPPTPPRRQSTLPDLVASASMSVSPTAVAVTPAEPIESSRSSETGEEDESTDQGGSPPPPPQMDVDEIRRRRLARFGGQS